MSQFKQTFSLIVPTSIVVELGPAHPRLICEVSHLVKTAITCHNLKKLNANTLDFRKRNVQNDNYTFLLTNN